METNTTTTTARDLDAERRINTYIADRIMVTRAGLGEKVWTRATDLNGDRTYLGTRVTNGAILADGTHIISTSRSDALLAIITAAGLDGCI